MMSCQPTAGWLSGKTFGGEPNTFITFSHCFCLGFLLNIVNYGEEQYQNFFYTLFGSLNHFGQNVLH